MSDNTVINPDPRKNSILPLISLNSSPVKRHSLEPMKNEMVSNESIDEIDASTRLIRNIKRIKDQYNKNRRFMIPGSLEIQKKDPNYNIIRLKRNKGLLIAKSHEKFKEQSKLFSVVDTFIDISGEFPKLSQIERIEEYLKQRESFKNVRKHKSLNIHSNKEFGGLNQLEFSLGYDKKDTIKTENKLDLFKKHNRSNLLIKTNHLLENRLNKEKLKISYEDNHQDINNLSYETNKNDNNHKDNENHQNDKDKMNDNDDSKNTNNNQLSCHERLVEYLKKDQYKYHIQSDEENPYDFYEKIESGNIFSMDNNNQRNRHQSMNHNDRLLSQKSLNKVVNNNDLDNISQKIKAKAMNLYDNNMIYQDSQNILINNLENYLVNSQKLIDDMNYRAKIIQRFGKNYFLNKKMYDMIKFESNKDDQLDISPQPNWYIPNGFLNGKTYDINKSQKDNHDANEIQKYAYNPDNQHQVKIKKTINFFKTKSNQSSMSNINADDIINYSTKEIEPSDVSMKFNKSFKDSKIDEDLIVSSKNNSSVNKLADIKINPKKRLNGLSLKIFKSSLEEASFPINNHHRLQPIKFPPKNKSPNPNSKDLHTLNASESVIIDSDGRKKSIETKRDLYQFSELIDNIDEISKQNLLDLKRIKRSRKEFHEIFNQNTSLIDRNIRNGRGSIESNMKGISKKQTLIRLQKLLLKKTSNK